MSRESRVVGAERTFRANDSRCSIYDGPQCLRLRLETHTHARCKHCDHTDCSCQSSRRNFDLGKNRHPSTDRQKFVAVDNRYVREVNNAIPDFVQYVHGGLRARRARYVKYNKFISYHIISYHIISYHIISYIFCSKVSHTNSKH